MGLHFVAFVGMWALMMTAMMLPSSIALATRVGPRTVDASIFAAGYLLVWAATGVPVYEAALAAGRLSQGHTAAATATAVALFVVAGLYQLSVPKERCLDRCRLRLSSAQARGRALGRGVGHGGWCVACSWATMALLIAAGVMNLFAMAAISLVLYGERHLFPGRAFRGRGWFPRLCRCGHPVPGGRPRPAWHAHGRHVEHVTGTLWAWLCRRISVVCARK